MTNALAALLLASLLLLSACGDQASPATSPSASTPGGSASATPGAIASAATAAAGGSPSASPTAAPTASPTPSPAPVPTPTRSPTPAPAISEFPQSWTGTWADPVTGGSGSLELTLTGKGADFGGSITMDGTACLSGGILTGSYDGRDIAFAVGQRDVEMRFAGRASAAVITGTFTTDCDAMDGTWTVSRSSR